MSYDLYFYRRTQTGLLDRLRAHTPDGGPNVEELVAYITLHSPHPPEFERTDDGFDAHYLNPETGTEMWFHLHQDEIDSHESEYRYRGFQYTGLSVMLNLPRPLYFGFEMAMLAGSLAEHFDLYILDPQMDDETPGRYPFGRLAISWVSSTDRIARGLVENGVVDPDGGCEFLVGPNFNHYMPHERSLEWWTYTFNRPDIVRVISKSGFDVYIPNLMLFRREGEKEVCRTMALNQECSYLVPDCDLFFILRDRYTDKGFVRRDRLMPELQEYLFPAELTFGGHSVKFHIMDADLVAEKTKILQTVELESPDSYRPVAPGNFMDVRLEAN
jgi:hypothetical protein